MKIITLVVAKRFRRAVKLRAGELLGHNLQGGSKKPWPEAEECGTMQSHSPEDEISFTTGVRGGVRVFEQPARKKKDLKELKILQNETKT